MQHTAFLNGCNFFSYFSLFFAQNMNCVYTLEPPLTSTHNLYLRAKKKETIMYAPVNPGFTIYVGHPISSDNGLISQKLV